MNFSSGVVPDGWRPGFVPATYQLSTRGSPASRIDGNNQIRSHQSPPPPLPPRVQSPNGGTCSDSSAGIPSVPLFMEANNSSAPASGRYIILKIHLRNTAIFCHDWCNISNYLSLLIVGTGVHPLFKMVPVDEWYRDIK